MKFSTLPSPGQLRVGQKLRQITTTAISAAEIRKGQSGLNSPELVAFFTAALAATPGAPGQNPLVASVTNGQKVTTGGVTYELTVADGQLTAITVVTAP